MREIKFRAWNITTNIYYYDIQNVHDEEIADSFQNILDNEELIVEQYTGLKDKNGVEIYENDIVNVRSRLYKDHIGAIIWFQGMASFCISDNTDEFNIPRPLGIQMDGFLSYEVIGNIHQDSDLLVDDTDHTSPDDSGNDIQESLHGGDK